MHAIPRNFSQFNAIPRIFNCFLFFAIIAQLRAMKWRKRKQPLRAIPRNCVQRNSDRKPYSQYIVVRHNKTHRCANIILCYFIRRVLQILRITTLNITQGIVVLFRQISYNGIKIFCV